MKEMYIVTRKNLFYHEDIAAYSNLEAAKKRVDTEVEKYLKTEADSIEPVSLREGPTGESIPYRFECHSLTAEAGRLAVIFLVQRLNRPISQVNKT